MKVKVLPDIVINQISAGEVVERPASVVRELVDNAVDAGASEITVELEQGGQSLIKVSDDGCGMQRDDALLAFERHATSKILCAADLDAIATMGFRGEALASIAAVAKVLLRTRTESQPLGTEVAIDGGVVRGVRETAAAPGTSIEVRALFYNTPARRKFLRSPKTEALRVKQWLVQSALARPQIRYRLIVDGVETLVLARAKDAVERARVLIKGTAVPVRYLGDRVQLEGLVAHPSLAQADSSSFIVLVNERVVSDRIVQKAVREGFDSTLKDREYPVGFIHLRLPASDVDVNVHPQKSEVRFRDSQAVFQLVREGVRKAVLDFKTPMTSPLAQSATMLGDRMYGQRHPVQFGVALGTKPYAEGGESQYQSNVGLRLATLTTDSSQAAFNLVVAQQTALAGIDGAPLAVGDSQHQFFGDSDFTFSRLNLIGQVLQCYLVAEFNDQLYIVDMHAAHERYNFNLIRNSFRTRKMSVQQLLIPEVVPLTEEGVARCLEEHELLSRFGFEFEQFGPAEIIVRALPSMLSATVARQVMREVAAVVCEGAASGRVEEQLDHIAARMACHASVRSGDALSRTEARALFAALDSTEFSAACPHGRPVVVSFPRAAVERWFGRDR
jgi:DNA mismatch repair protein MutL